MRIFKTITTIVVVALLTACSGGSGGSRSPSTEISVSQNDLQFTARWGETSGQLTKTINVTYSGAGIAVGYPPGQAAPSWLSLSAQSGSVSSSATVSIMVSTSVAPRDYETTIRIATGDENGNSIVYKDVKVNYSLKDNLFVSPPTDVVSSLWPNPPNNQFKLYAGVRTYNSVWKVTTNKPWLVPDISSGTGNAIVTFSIDYLQLPIGEKVATITFTADALELSKTVSSRFVVNAPEIKLSKSALTITGFNGGKSEPQTLNIGLSNGAAATWRVTAPEPLTLSKTEGNADTGLDVNVNTEANESVAGSVERNMTISFALPGKTIEKTIPVITSLAPMRQFVVDNAAAFTRLPFTSVLTKQVGVFRSDGLNPRNVDVQSQASWLRAIVIDNKIELSADPNGLQNGQYFTNVIVKSTWSRVVNEDKITVGFYIGDETSTDHLFRLDADVASVTADPFRPRFYVTRQKENVINVVHSYTGQMLQIISFPFSNELQTTLISDDGKKLIVNVVGMPFLQQYDLDTGIWSATAVPATANSLLRHVRVSGHSFISDGRCYFDFNTGAKVSEGNLACLGLNYRFDRLHVARAADGVVYVRTHYELVRKQLSFDEQLQKIKEKDFYVLGSATLRDVAVFPDAKSLYATSWISTPVNPDRFNWVNDTHEFIGTLNNPAAVSAVALLPSGGLAMTLTDYRTAPGSSSVVFTNEQGATIKQVALTDADDIPYQSSLLSGDGKRLIGYADVGIGNPRLIYVLATE